MVATLETSDAVTAAVGKNGILLAAASALQFSGIAYNMKQAIQVPGIFRRTTQVQPYELHILLEDYIPA